MYSVDNINILIPTKADVDSLIRSGVSASMHVTSRDVKPEECVVYCVKTNKLYMVFNHGFNNKNVSPETVRQFMLLDSEEARIVYAEALGLKRGPDYG